MSTADEDERWLVGPAAKPYLAEAAAGTDDELHLLTRLRKALPAQRARLVVEQALLRRKARSKFVHADRLFFTSVGLEQATDEVTARYKAARFPPGGRIIDFCCGIGGDLLALGFRGPTTGVDRSPVVALRAAANTQSLRAIAGEAFRASVEESSVEPSRAAECDAWHLDPDRRPQGRRTTQIDLHEPSTATIDAMLAVNENAAIKLAPAAALPQAWLDRAECEWISRDGETRQLVAWFGNLSAQLGTRRATRLVGDAAHTFTGTADAVPQSVAELGRFLYEPDAAVLAAGLEGSLAEQYQIALVHPRSVYLTSDALCTTPLLTAFEIRDEMPFDSRHLRGYLHERGIGRLEILKRGVDVDPARLRRELQLTGDREASLILVRRGDRVTAVVARRVGT